jgi:hypothetical protein
LLKGETGKDEFVQTTAKKTSGILKYKKGDSEIDAGTSTSKGTGCEKESKTESLNLNINIKNESIDVLYHLKFLRLFKIKRDK